MIIKKVSASKIKDSRGDFTIEVGVNGCYSSSPSGKSKGKYESKPYYKNIDFCIKFLNSWKEKVEINNFEDLKYVERIIRKKLGIKKAKYFGGNSLFAFESAILKALAKDKKKQLWEIINPYARKMPIPVGNAVGGGMHSSNKGKTSFQEFLIIPKRKTISDNYRVMKDIYQKIGKAIGSKKRNDEGAWEINFNEEKIISLISSYNVNIGVDIAASSFYENARYKYKNRKISRKEQINFINNLIKKYGILYVEDPLHEDDFKGFSNITKDGLIIGDDLTATNLDRIRNAVKIKSINAVIIKPNQNGSLIEVADIIDYCRNNGIKTIFSHRSGETMDDALGDYAFGFQTDYIKTGIFGKERKVKLKRLISIEKSIN